MKSREVVNQVDAQKKNGKEDLNVKVQEKRPVDILKPLADRVVLKPLEKGGEKSYGNIVLPDMGKERPELAVVVAVGPGRVSEFGAKIVTHVEPGQTVMVPKIGPLKFELSGQSYLVVQDKEILGIVKRG